MSRLSRLRRSLEAVIIWWGLSVFFAGLAWFSFLLFAAHNWMRHAIFCVVAGVPLAILATNTLPGRMFRLMDKIDEEESHRRKHSQY